MAICAEANAQRFLIKGGLNFSTINESFQTRKVKYGALLGVAFEYPLLKHLSIQPELNFVQKGYKYEFEYKNELAYGFHRFALETNYFEIPILLKYQFSSTKVKYSLLIGPTVSGLFSGNFKTYSVYAYRLPPDISEYERTNKIRFDEWPYPGDGAGGGYNIIENWLELGVHFGGQFEFFEKVILDVRYGLGLTSFYSLRYEERIPDGKFTNTKNRGIQISVAVPINKITSLIRKKREEN